MQRKLLKAFFLNFFFLSPYVLTLEIEVDGILDEKEWSQAKEITKYYESLPFTLNDASGSQKVLVLEDEDGILSLIHI